MEMSFSHLKGEVVYFTIKILLLASLLQELLQGFAWSRFWMVFTFLNFYFPISVL